MNNTDVVILCGGRGKRLREAVGDRPKVMAEIGGRPFLDILIDYAAAYGLKRFILCAGYKASYIADYYQGRRDHTFVISKEDAPLGTAGAIKNAERFIITDPFIIMNGDSFCPVDLKGFLAFHKNKSAVASVAVVKAIETEDFGSIIMNSGQRVTAFKEKQDKQSAFINAGIYCFERQALPLIPPNTKMSLEYELFPELINRGLYGFISGKELFDIGTPQRYKQAKTLLTGGKLS